MRTKPNAGRKDCDNFGMRQKLFLVCVWNNFFQLYRLYCEQVTNNSLPSYDVFKSPFGDLNEHVGGY